MNNIKNKSDIVLYVCYNILEVPSNTGVPRVVRSVAKNLIEYGKRIVPIGYDKDTKNIYILNDEQLDIVSRCGGPEPSTWERTHTIDYYLNNADYALILELLYNGNENIIDDLKNIKKYIVFYDILPIALPEMYGQTWVKGHYKYLKKAKKCNKIFSISEFSKNEYLKLIDNNIDNIETVSLPNYYSEWPSVEEKVNDTKNINIFSIGTIEKKKNHKTLLKAFYMAEQELKKDGYNLQLNLLGKNYSNFDDIEDYINEYKKISNIVWHDTVADEKEVYEFYKNADFTIYPSFYEGYGLPIVESLFLNTPCISSNTTSMPEITKDGGCLTFDPNNVEELRDLIILLSTNSKKRRKLVREMQGIKKRTWKDYVSDIIESIEKDIYE
jgi:glycosyltransferase involved in cell wall biosynthesis